MTKLLYQPLSVSAVGMNHLRRLARDEGGVALVVTLGIFLFMWLVCCGVYTVGETVRRKIQIQNAADAAAYSAAVVQADFLSRVATVNRAMAWTYVQMTRRQMDHIVHTWINKVQERIDADRNAMRFWYFSSTAVCSHPQHNKILFMPSRETYWCGFPPQYDEMFAINNDNPQQGNVLQKTVKAEKTWYPDEVRRRNSASGGRGDHEQQIKNDKRNISAMNKAVLESLPKQYVLEVERVVREAVRANLPADELDQFIYVLVKKNPLNCPAYCWFKDLQNNKPDERRFLTFAGDYYEKEVRRAFNKNVEDGRKSGGINTWFVRCDDSQKPETSNAVGSGSKGIQRCYRFTKPFTKQWKQSRGSPVWPQRNWDIDGNDASPNPASGLVAEWYHHATQWQCKVTPWGEQHIGIPYFQGNMHCAWSQGDIGYVDQAGHNCVQGGVGTSLGMRLGTVPLALPGLAGGGRLYGDDPAILVMDLYTGERCRPQILNGEKETGFFGRGGAILVGVARKATNPWEQILGKVEGMFKAFDFSSGVTHLWAVSAARAGYKEWDEQDETLYQLGYKRDDGNDFRKCWNLRQTDWDAMFLPVHYAYHYCEKTRFKFVQPGPNEGNPLEEVMDFGKWQPIAGNLNAHRNWNNPAAPRGFTSGQEMNWKQLNEKVRH